MSLFSTQQFSLPYTGEQPPSWYQLICDAVKHVTAVSHCLLQGSLNPQHCSGQAAAQAALPHSQPRPTQDFINHLQDDPRAWVKALIKIKENEKFVKNKLVVFQGDTFLGFSFS